jgi:hypothetical protein
MPRSWPKGQLRAEQNEEGKNCSIMISTLKIGHFPVTGVERARVLGAVRVI